MTTVSAPLPEGTRSEVAAESTAVLRKRVAASGLCRPGAASTTVVTFHASVAAPHPSDVGGADKTHDLWFPLEETGVKAVAQARRACKGCPVKDECGVLAYREEAASGDVHGVRGGLCAGERRDALRQFRAPKGGAR
ncbi:WhiB family transcriptional regulator [Krasilnikovia cinnamomea]|nr:WhiB family transcriptional regulator [Krasilnikovia cinnamomea]